MNPMHLVQSLSTPVSRKEATVSCLLLSFLFVCCSPLAEALTDTTTSITLTSNRAPVTAVQPHTPITLTATVKAGSAVLKQGQVKFCDTTPPCQDIHLLGLSQLTPAGTATLRFVAGPGSHSYRAVFLGTRSNTPSESAASSVTVEQSESYMSKTTLAASGSAGSYTLKADVSGVGTTAPPTGTVYFQDRSNNFAELGKAQLSAGVQELSWPAYQFGKIGENQVSQAAIVTADFNHDGHVDLVVADLGVIYILSGDGKGFFTESSLFLPSRREGPYAPDLLVGDFNNDGSADLIDEDGTADIAAIASPRENHYKLASSSLAGIWRCPYSSAPLSSHCLARLRFHRQREQPAPIVSPPAQTQSTR